MNRPVPSRRPAVTFGLRRRQRANGEPFMVAIVNENMQLVAGTELHLRRVAQAGADEAEFALQVLPPVAPWEPSKAEEQRALAGRLDGSAIRVDARDAAVQPQEAPW